MKNYIFLIALFILPNFMFSQVMWDNFEDTRIGYYEFVHGGMTTRYANPDMTSFVNTSSTCAQYVRNPGELWDVLVIIANGPMADVSDYVNGTKTMSVDVYSPAAGIPVQITLEDSTLAGPTNYPTGRHSIYLGATTVANEWENITLTFDSQPDASMSDIGLSSLILLFNGGTNTGDIYYFDNLYGPELNSQCDGFTSDPVKDLADWDCSWNLGMCPSATACPSYDYMSGWLNQVYNPETSTINNSKYCGEYTRNPDANGEDVFIAYALNGDFEIGLYPFFNMKVYGPPTSVYVSFQNNGSEVIGFEQGIWQNNTWQQLNFDLSSVSSGSMSVDRVVFFFDQGMVNWDKYYIDDLGLSAAPVTVLENSSEFEISSYPVPAKENINIAFTISKNSSVLIELIDINGRTLETFINKNLSPNTYSYKTHKTLSQGLYLIRSTINSSVYTHKVEVIK